MVDPPGHEQDLAFPPDRASLLVQAREDDHLGRALEVLHGHDRHRCLGLGDHGPDAGHDSADDHPLPVERLVAQVARVGRDELADPLCHLAHRVLREVQAEELLLPAEPLAHRHLGGGGQRALEGRGVGRPQVEQRGLPRDAVALCRLRHGHGILEAEQDLRRVAERVERAHLRQGLEHLAVGEAEVDARAEVGQRAERAALLARGDDQFDRTLADVLDRQQAEADRIALDGELEMAAVHVGRQDRDPHPPALGDGRRDLLLVRQLARHVDGSSLQFREEDVECLRVPMSCARPALSASRVLDPTTVHPWRASR